MDFDSKRRCNSLKALGYEIDVTWKGYTIKQNGNFVSGATIRTNGYGYNEPHWQTKRKNVKDNWVSAISTAEQHSRGN